MKDIYIITTSDLPNNVILGHASFAKSAGFNPIFVFPDRGHGNKYLKYGFGFGGPCLPRDNKALAKYGSEIGLNALISIASDNSNFQHLEHQIDYFIQNNSKEKPVYIAGVSYKKNTDIIEESQQFKFAFPC